MAGDPYYWWERSTIPVNHTWTPLTHQGWWCEKCEVTNSPHIKQCPSCWKNMQRKVIVAIEIESCCECPHFYAAWSANKNNFCLEEDRVIDDFSTIPDWCPFYEKCSISIPTEPSTISNGSDYNGLFG